MDKILVEIICPSLSRKWDFWCAVDAKIAEIISIVISQIQEYENAPDVFDGFDRIDLYNKNGEVLNPDFTIKESGVHSGDSLMII